MKYWAYVNNEILGPYEKEKLLQLPSFAPSLLICPQTPVGEKTEDWKEASSYPEIAAALGGSIQQAAPAAAPAEAAPEPVMTQSGHELKPLTAAAVDPVPPRESVHSGVDLAVNKLERSGRFSAPQGDSTDPISLSAIGRKADTISSGLAKDPKPAFSPQAAQSGGIDIGLPPRDASGPAIEANPPISLTPEPAPAPAAAAAPASFDFSAQAAPAAAAPAFAAPAAAAGPVPGLEELNRKLDQLAMNSVSRQDLAGLGDLRMKLDQMGEVLSSIKTSQFQNIIEKLSYLENAVAELKSAGGRGAAQAAAAPAAETPAAFVNPFATPQPAPAPQEQKKPEPDPKKTVIVDQGTKTGLGARLGGLFKKLFKFVLVLALLVGALYGAAVGLKMANVFDATTVLPALAGLPGLAGAPAAPAEPQPPAVEESTSTVKAEPKPVDVSPEVIYFARNYAAVPNGARLEDKITELAAAAGGTYNPANWTAKSTGPDTFDAAASVPLKKGALTFTFAVDYAKKTLAPSDEAGKKAFDALTPPAPARKGRGKRGARAAAAKAEAPAEEAAPAAAPAKGKTAPAKSRAAKAPKKPAEEEYEYEYEEE